MSRRAVHRLRESKLRPCPGTVLHTGQTPVLLLRYPLGAITLHQPGLFALFPAGGAQRATGRGWQIRRHTACVSDGSTSRKSRAIRLHRPSRSAARGGAFAQTTSVQIPGGRVKAAGLGDSSPPTPAPVLRRPSRIAGILPAIRGRDALDTNQTPSPLWRGDSGSCRQADRLECGRNAGHGWTGYSIYLG